jgi:hypothetical protein
MRKVLRKSSGLSKGDRNIGVWDEKESDPIFVGDRKKLAVCIKKGRVSPVFLGGVQSFCSPVWVGSFRECLQALACLGARKTHSQCRSDSAGGRVGGQRRQGSSCSFCQGLWPGGPGLDQWERSRSKKPKKLTTQWRLGAARQSRVEERRALAGPPKKGQGAG